jgi:hypothetical protein
VDSETLGKIQDLMVNSQKHKISPIVSIKEKRKATSDILLKSQHIKHGKNCNRCNLNCEVKHLESIDFWAIKEGLEHKYTLETCPRQDKLDKVKLKRKRRVK